LRRIAPSKGTLRVTDDEVRHSIETGQLKLQRERGTDLTIFSPRASGMGHHFGGELISRYWTEHNNDLIYRVCQLFRDNFAGVCMLPRSPGVSPAGSDADRHKLFEGNARTVFPRLDQQLRERGT